MSSDKARSGGRDSGSLWKSLVRSLPTLPYEGGSTCIVSACSDILNCFFSGDMIKPSHRSALFCQSSTQTRSAPRELPTQPADASMAWPCRKIFVCVWQVGKELLDPTSIWKWEIMAQDMETTPFLPFFNLFQKYFRITNCSRGIDVYLLLQHMETEISQQPKLLPIVCESGLN